MKKIENETMNVAVYCSARAGLPAEVVDDARRLGAFLGRNGHTLVYGGLSLGLMHEVADAAAGAGGKVIGVVPQSRLEYQHPANNVNLHVCTLHERKQTMEENANVFVALDGGYGTLDEVMSALATGAFFRERKPIFLLDRNGLYRPLIDLLDGMVARGLAHPDVRARLTLCPDIESLIEALERVEVADV